LHRQSVYCLAAPMTSANLRRDIRNVAIIAHVDHGKTTLVDALLKQSHTFRDNQEVGTLIMDSNDLEREKGITILAKNTSVRHGDVTINIIDTPKTLERVHDLFLELAEDADQLEAPVIYSIAKEGRAGLSPDELGPDLEPLFKTIIDFVPSPVTEPGGFQMLVANRAYDDYTG